MIGCFALLNDTFLKRNQYNIKLRLSGPSAEQIPVTVETITY